MYFLSSKFVLDIMSSPAVDDAKQPDLSKATNNVEFVANQRTEQVTNKVLLNEGITQIHHVYAFGIIPFRINFTSQNQQFIEYLGPNLGED